MEEFKSAKGERMENSVSVEYFRGKADSKHLCRQGPALYNFNVCKGNPEDSKDYFNDD
jgi:hypothetical protein